eukprot:CAMPEP_0116016174 /NCGR_PEP_ID=MMETSP0321-20121206/7301_1 /TAXON_ID=163516 /ORGANISM="Leptocylindrus danicus var. danicus, Strain B650" /LENGTH=210 /DNA_ID=CAMNT_0003486137 /DNA_START=948 /DNA_END=1582 /DNA_ORIENTATION=+
MARKPPLICPQRHHQTLILHLINPSNPNNNKDDVIGASILESTRILKDHLSLSTGPVEAMQVLLLADDDNAHCSGEITVDDAVVRTIIIILTGNESVEKKTQILNWQSSACALRFLHESLSQCFEAHDQQQRSSRRHRASEPKEETTDDHVDDDGDNHAAIMSRDLCRSIQRLNDLLAWRYDGHEHEEPQMMSSKGNNSDGGVALIPFDV